MILEKVVNSGIERATIGWVGFRASVQHPRIPWK